MEYADYNDNEIIYLIKKGNEDALLFLISKYRKMIYSRINKFKIHEVEDAFQDCLISLYSAVMTYDENINKTFNKYFEVVLFNKLSDLKRKMRLDYEFILSENIIRNTCAISEDIETLSKRNRIDDILDIIDCLNKREKNIFQEYYIENMDIDEIALNILILYYLNS